MSMLRLVLILTLTLISAPAAAGIRATYGAPRSAPKVIEIADNGDINADIAEGWHLIVLAGRAYIIQDRLTGPLVMRADDLAALLPSANPQGGSPASGSGLVQRGTAEVNGWTGQAYFFTHASGTDAETPAAVISSDPALNALGSAMRRVFAAQDLVGEIEWGWPPALARGDDALYALLDHGAPLRFGNDTLRTFEQVPIDAARFALPAEPESAEALRRRHAAEAQEDRDPNSRNRMISRAVFADERLWLLTDQGQLSSLAEGERTRRIHDLGAKVIDVCVRANMPIALTGERGDGESWTIWRWQAGSWRTARTIARRFDALVALSCGADEEMVLTSQRLIDLTGRSRAVTLSEPLYPAQVRTVVHVTPEAAWVGINRGEWGGGLRRIDRRSGAVTIVERNGTGDLCDGPLNTACDPVNGIATIPWRPQCVAAAIGLIHMEAHGRIASICPDGVNQLFVAADAVDPSNAAEAEQAAKGGYGAVAFFGLAATQDALIAAGHNGLYRIDARGAGARQPWPRFTEVDGILVSFALPNLVLVMSELNRRASVSGVAPLMAVR
jgi:hypothetical protein